MSSDNERSELNSRPESRQGQEAPDALKPLHAVAQGYRYYMNYLKEGGSSGISEFFGSASEIFGTNKESPLSPPMGIDKASKSKEDKIEHGDLSANSQDLAENQANPREIFTNPELVKQGILKRALSTTRHDWMKAKVESKDPFDLMQKYNVHVQALNEKFSQQGILKDGYSVVGFVTNSKNNTESLLVADSNSIEPRAYAINPETGDVQDTFRQTIENFRLTLDHLD